MRISAVVTTNIAGKESIVKDRAIIISFAVSLLAVISGTLIYIFAESLIFDEILNIFTRFSTDFTAKTKTEIFSGIILSHIPYVFLVAIFGMTSIGVYLVSVVSFIKISGISIVNAYLYSSFGLKGIEYAALVFLPAKFILIFSVIYLMHTAMNNSIYINRLTKGERVQENSGISYLIKVIAAVILLIIASITEGVLATSFSSLFEF